MEPQHVDRRMTAILAADVAGYSRLMQADEEGTLARLKSLRRELIDPKIKEHRGRIVKTTGDGMLVEFPSVVEAVRCAIEVQQGMADRNANTPKHERIEFRVGVNLGDVIFDEEDIYGDGVNIAARLENLAQPGSINISGTAFDHVENKISLRCKFLGAQRVKNIAQPVRVYSIRLEPSATATAPRGQRRTGLVAGAALLIVIGVAAAVYVQHHASLTETASMPPGPKSDAQGATASPEVPKETPPLDAQVWEAIRSSTNPADFEAYLRIFPSGAVADLARARLRALAPERHPPASTTEPTLAAAVPTPQQNAIATEPAPPQIPAPQPPASTDAPATTRPNPAPQQQAIATGSAPPPVEAPQPPASTNAPTSTAPTPAPRPPASTAGPISATRAPIPQQKPIATRSAPPPAPAPQPPASPNASNSTTSTPAPQPPASTNASTSTAPTSAPQVQIGAAESPTATAPAAGPQQQALVAPDMSKSVTSPALPGAPYDGEWKGFSLGTSPTCIRGPCRENVEVTVAKNAVSGELKGYLSNAKLSGTIANDGSFSGKLGDAHISGKFDADRFQGVISGSLTLSGGTSSAALFLERVR